MTETTETATQPGLSYPIGATVAPDGVNFSVSTRRASGIELLLFDDVDAGRPSRVITLDPPSTAPMTTGTSLCRASRRVSSTPSAPMDRMRRIRAALRSRQGAAGSVRPRRGRAQPYSRNAATNPGDNARTAMKSMVIDPRVYAWEGDRPLRRPFAETIIYEMHVRGFTRHPSSGVAPEQRGTYAGLIEKIPYLQDLGITAVELLPVFQFDPYDTPRGRINYWGYSPVSFFAPHVQYSVSQAPGCRREFRDMVKALHPPGSK